MTELISLFINGLVSATILPGTSEVYFLYLLSENLAVMPGFIAVSTGNILGAIVSFFMGWGLISAFNRKKIIISDKSKLQIDKFGPVILIFSWLPIIGDPLVIAAGAMKLNFYQCLLWITLGKSFRYFLLILPFLP